MPNLLTPHDLFMDSTRHQFGRPCEMLTEISDRKREINLFREQSPGVDTCVKYQPRSADVFSNLSVKRRGNQIHPFG